MLNTTIEIWPYGAHGRRQACAHIAIWNRGVYYEDEVQYADYGYVVTEEYDRRFFEEACEPLSDAEIVHLARLEGFDDDRIRAAGTVYRHPRQEGSTVLLGKVLADAGLAS